MVQIYGKEVSFDEGKNTGPHLLALLKIIEEKIAEASPITVRTELTPVADADIGIDYKEGSQGQIKEIHEYDGAGNTLKITTLKYQNSEDPEFVTEIEEL